jgi:Ferritin-like
LTEAPIVVENRDELIFLLTEASELEHMVMLAYLFAAFSLKTDASEGLSEEQLQAVRRWERVISEVAAQEMLHLASASNLLTAIGGVPHFSRPNFPQPAKYYPPGFELALMPFSEQALGSFVFYERPEGMEHDAPELQLASEVIAPLIPGGGGGPRGRHVVEFCELQAVAEFVFVVEAVEHRGHPPAEAARLPKRPRHVCE